MAPHHGASTRTIKSLYLDHLPNEAIDVVAEHLPSKNSPMTFLPILPLGGAYSDIDDDATAFGGSRRARVNFDMAAVAPNPELLAADRARVRAYGRGCSRMPTSRPATSTSCPNTRRNGSAKRTARPSMSGWRGSKPSTIRTMCSSSTSRPTSSPHQPAKRERRSGSGGPATGHQPAAVARSRPAPRARRAAPPRPDR